MKIKKLIKYFIVILLVILIIIFVCKNFKKENQEESSTSSEFEVIRTDIINTVSSSSYISSALEEKKQLHASYYFDEIYFEKNQYIKEGENILKYTNGSYMVAPYNCVITEMSIPNGNEQCTNQHYITIQSTDILNISLDVEEKDISSINIGQEAIIEVTALDDKSITGYVINIDNIATYSSSGSTFKTVVQFQNDGSILLGMTAKCSIILEKAENVVGVANEAISEQNGKKYVVVKNEDGSTKNIEVETGIENDAYTEIKSGLNEGDIVVIEKTEESNKQNNMMQRNYKNQRSGGDSPQDMKSDMQSDMQHQSIPQN